MKLAAASGTASTLAALTIVQPDPPVPQGMRSPAYVSGDAIFGGEPRPSLENDERDDGYVSGMPHNPHRYQSLGGQPLRHLTRCKTVAT
jgi:hypothetical protein